MRDAVNHVESNPVALWPVALWPEARSISKRYGLAMLLALAGLLVSCTSTIVPPAEVIDPVTVFVLSEAMHTGIVLPPDPGCSGNPHEYVEFGFGDWSWYALGNAAWYNG